MPSMTTTDISLTGIGSGRPALVLHGGGGPATVGMIAEHLGGFMHAILPTHAGWNGTPRPDWIRSVADLAGCYLSVAQGLLRRADVLLLDEPTKGLDLGAAERLLAGVREFDPDAAMVIALHGRQSPALPWTPSTRIDLGAPDGPT